MNEHRRSTFNVSRRLDGNDLSLYVGSRGNDNAIVNGNREGRLRVNRIAFVIRFGRNCIFQRNRNAGTRWNDKFTGAPVRSLSESWGRSIFRWRLWRYLRLGALLCRSEATKKYQRKQNSHWAPPSNKRNRNCYSKYDASYLSKVMLARANFEVWGAWTYVTRRSNCAHCYID